MSPSFTSKRSCRTERQSLFAALHTTKEKRLCLTQDASFVAHFTTRTHWWSSGCFSLLLQLCIRTERLTQLQEVDLTWPLAHEERSGGNFSLINVAPFKDVLSMCLWHSWRRLGHSTQRNCKCVILSQISGSKDRWHQAILYSALFLGYRGEPGVCLGGGGWRGTHANTNIPWSCCCYCLSLSLSVSNQTGGNGECG